MNAGGRRHERRMLRPQSSLSQLRWHSAADASRPAALLLAQVLPDMFARHALPAARPSAFGPHRSYDRDHLARVRYTRAQVVTSGR